MEWAETCSSQAGERELPKDNINVIRERALLLHPKSQHICLKAAARRQVRAVWFIIQALCTQSDSLACYSEGLETGIRLASKDRA